MHAWMILWTVLLVGSVVAFAGLLIVIGLGAIRELHQMLSDLKNEQSTAIDSTRPSGSDGQSDGQ